MRPLVFALSVLLPGLACGQETDPSDLKASNGQTYKPVAVVRVEPDGITYAYPVGLSKVSFTDLPEAVRKQYGYDPAKAAAYAAADAEHQAEYEQSYEALREQAFQHDLELAIQAAKDIDALPKDAGIGAHNPLDASPVDGVGGGGHRRRGTRARKDHPG